MPAKDRYHDAVKNALTHDGWKITADPYPIKYEEVKLAADLSSQKTLSANRGTEYIVVEIKSFLSRSPMREFETALGQYLIYRTFLSVISPEYHVYLAVGSDINRTFFQRVTIQLILKTYHVSLLVVDLDKEVIEKWIP